MRKLNVLTLIVMAAAPVFGQVAPAPTQTLGIAGARFEVIQSARAARDTFKLDRYNGEVYMLAVDHEGRSFWALTNWTEKPRPAATDTGVRFQLFLGSQRVSDAYLLDLVTGKTWVWSIVGNATDFNASISDLAWVPMRDAIVVPPAKTLDYIPQAGK